jgi:dTDP-4-dehydrorhamnose 3,5-epimerase
MDVVVDLRKDSKTFGKTFQVVLDAEKGNMLYVPEGFAHGIAVYEDTIFSYKCSAYYHQPSERGIHYADADLGIDWGVETPIVSEKDKILPGFKSYCEENELS